MKKQYLPFARVIELRKEPDAHLYLTKAGKSFDVQVLKFPSRLALEEFNKRAGWKPLVYTQVKLNCAIYAHESDSEARNARQTVETA